MVCTTCCEATSITEMEQLELRLKNLPRLTTQIWVMAGLKNMSAGRSPTGMALTIRWAGSSASGRKAST